MTIRSHIRSWRKWLRDKQRRKAVEAAERERRAIQRQISLRRDKRAEWKPKMADLQRSTCRSIAAQFGKPWAY